MCSKDFEYQEFVLEGKKWNEKEQEWWKRLEQYYMLLD